MTSGSSRTSPASGLTQAQIDQIRSSPFLQDAPQVTVDLRGSTPFDTNDFFRVSFDLGPTEISLRRLTVDLTPAAAFFDPTSAPPGLSGSPFRLGSLNGVAGSDLSVSGGFDGSQLLSISFAPGAFTRGDSFSFGNDIDLFSAIDSFGATPSELIGSLFSFEFDFGLSTQTALDSALFVQSNNVTQILPSSGMTTPFGPQLAPGQLPPVGTLGQRDPVLVATAVPEPTPLALLLAPIGWLVFRRRR